MRDGKSPAIAVLFLRCVEEKRVSIAVWGPVPVRLPAAALESHLACFGVRWVSATVANRGCDMVWLRVLAIFLSVFVLVPSYSIQSGRGDGTFL